MVVGYGSVVLGVVMEGNMSDLCLERKHCVAYFGSIDVGCGVEEFANSHLGVCFGNSPHQQTQGAGSLGIAARHPAVLVPADQHPDGYASVEVGNGLL